MLAVEQRAGTVDVAGVELDFTAADTTLTTRTHALSLGCLRGAFAGEPLACPAAPPGGELGLLPRLGAVPISLAHVVEATRILGPGGFDQTVELSGDATGELTWKVRWTLTLRRVRP